MGHDCLSLTELQERLDDGGERARLSDCPRCLALFELLRRREDGPVIALDFADDAEAVPPYQPHIPERGGDDDLKPGTVVSVMDPAAGTGTLLLGAITVVRDSSLELAPMTTELEMATEWDLLLKADESSLGYATAVEVWNHGTVGRDQVDETLGEIEDSKLKWLLDLWETVFVEATPPANVTVGPPLLDDADPRLLFQAAEIERAQRFWQLDEPTAGSAIEIAYEVEEEPRAPRTVAASTVSSVGVIAEDWMSREGWDLDDLARESGYLKYQLEPILEDRIDPCAGAYSPEKLGRLLKVIEFEDDEETLLASVDASVFPPEIEKEERYAFNRDGLKGRKRRGPRNGRTQLGLTAAQVDQARSYARDVLAALEELRES